MINFFKSKKKNVVNKAASYSKIASLLIHAAKIDESYSNKEKKIIRRALVDLGADSSNIEKLISDATIIEENSNQILDFTREVKNTSESDKKKLLKLCGKLFIQMIVQICMKQIS